MNEQTTTPAGRRPLTPSETREKAKSLVSLEEADARAAERDRVYTMATTVGFIPSLHTDLDMLLTNQPLLEPVHELHRRMKELESRVDDLESKAEDLERNSASESFVEEEIDRRIATAIEEVPNEEDIRKFADEQINEVKDEYEGLCAVRDGWDDLNNKVDELQDKLDMARAQVAEATAALMARGLLSCPLCKAAVGKKCASPCPNPSTRPQQPNSLELFAYCKQDPDTGDVPPQWKVAHKWLWYRIMYLLERI